jgi:NAD(P)-dependent dehydrogenase (short-subunit alcohol dehydrogenase family)
MNLTGKTAIVTGSSMGIGKSIAEHLAMNGARVIINGRSGDKLKATLSEFKHAGYAVSAFNGDVSKPEDCKELMAYVKTEYGGIDILVNNVGVGARGHFENINPVVFQQVFNSNILGAVYPTLEAMSHLKTSRGSVVFISSLAGLRGMPNAAPYCMSKMALTALAETLRVETAMYGVHVGIVYVGMTKNDPEKKVIHADGSWANLQIHDSVFVDTPADTARTVIEAIKSRSFKKIVGLKGKAYYWLQMLAPWVVDFSFKNGMKTLGEAQR